MNMQALMKQAQAMQKEITGIKNEIDNTIFEGCHFINCRFYDLQVNVVEKNAEESMFVSCVGHEALQNALSVENNETEKNEMSKDQDYYIKLVLEQFWMTGSQAK